LRVTSITSWPREWQKTCRECCEKKKKNPKVQDLMLGGCTNFQLVLDIVQAAKETQFIMFHSIDRSHPLIDSIYQDGTDIFHAFQVTLGSNHTANSMEMKKLEQRVGGWKKMNLYYLVTDFNFTGFVTNPRKARDKGVVWKVLIPDPYGSSVN
jgi:hypothetical protein